MEEKTITYKKGDLVDFKGGFFYKTSDSPVYFSASPCVAEVMLVMPNAPYPLFLKAQNKKQSRLKGWVRLEDVAGIHQPTVEEKEIKSFANSRIVKVAMAEDNKINTQFNAVPWKENDWIAVYRPRNPKDAENLAYAAEKACAQKDFDLFIAPMTTAEVCFKMAGIDVGSINKDNLIASGLFYFLNSDFYTAQFKFLRRGDVLIGFEGSAIVLTNGPASSEQKQATKVQE